jgi:hypothetical protein
METATRVLPLWPVIVEIGLYAVEDSMKACSEAQQLRIGKTLL